MLRYPVPIIELYDSNTARDIRTGVCTRSSEKDLVGISFLNPTANSGLGTLKFFSPSILSLAGNLISFEQIEKGLKPGFTVSCGQTFIHFRVVEDGGGAGVGSH